jgi:hypothetical protein
MSFKSKKTLFFILFLSWLYKEYKHRKRYLQMESEINSKAITQDPFQYQQMAHFLKSPISYHTISNCFGGADPEKISDFQFLKMFQSILPNNAEGVIEMLFSVRSWLKQSGETNIISIYGENYVTQPKKIYLPWCVNLFFELLEQFGHYYLRQQSLSFTYRNRIPFWYRIEDDSVPVVFFHGLTGSTLMVHETVNAVPHKNVIIPMYPPIMVGFDKKDSHLVDLDEYWNEIENFLNEHNFKEIDIIAWSYGGYTSTGFLMKKKFKVRKQMLMEPAGNPYTCSLAIWLMNDTYYKTYQVMNKESKCKSRLFSWMMAFILHSYKSTRCCKYNLPFRHCEWGENWNNEDTLILLSKDDPLMSVDKVKPFYDTYTPKAKILIGDGVHGSWIFHAKIDRCIKEWFSFGIEFTFQ